MGRGGGIGRHAVLRGPWAQARVGSSPALGTKKINPGDVAKWSKAEVCKTSIRRFESARRLQPYPPICYKPRWRNGRRGGLKIRCPLKACGFESLPRYQN